MYRQQTRRKRLAVHTNNVVTRLFAAGEPACKRSFFVQSSDGSCLRIFRRKTKRDLAAGEWFSESRQYFHY